MKAKQIQSYDIPLHDIKTIVEVQEYSLYYLLATGAGVIILLALFGYLFYKFMQKRNAFNIRKVHLKLINDLDLSDTKQSAYAITTYGATFAEDSQRHAEMYANIVNRLESFKYKKEVDAFDSEVLGYIELYKGMLDV